MTNLVDQYGPDWFNNKFGSTMFRHKGVACRVIEATSRRVGRKSVNEVMCRAVSRVNGKLQAANIRLPASGFSDTDMFSSGELGYRHAEKGKYLVYVRRNNSSYARGMSLRNLVYQESALTSFLVDEGLLSYFPNEDEQHLMVMEPSFIPIRRGIKLMLEGKIASFAASPTIAVVPHTDAESLVVLFCDKQIGTVSADGVVNITVPLAQPFIEERL